jgi:hypothetical protein
MSEWTADSLGDIQFWHACCDEFDKIKGLTGRCRTHPPMYLYVEGYIDFSFCCGRDSRVLIRHQAGKQLPFVALSDTQSTGTPIKSSQELYSILSSLVKS